VIEVWKVSSYVDLSGAQSGILFESMHVEDDLAHELADGPVMHTEVARQERLLGDKWMPVVWTVSAVGFVDVEAIEAHDQAVEELRACFVYR
jgi:hypothetical protein